MTKKHRQHFENRLLRERERALRALAKFDEMAKLTPQEEDGDLTMYPLHLADEGTDTDEQEKGFLLASKEGRLLYWIDDALRTLYKEPQRYGRCAGCGDDIVFERLDLVPWTKLCIDCQRGEELRLDAA
ncbi:MAG: TraR/DksA C4-type zinc finger protein [Gemmatimonadetes bacterium]|nr:TraR/DksA C4-type zinc finger protein [Gemmatimonadota bacterium]